DDDRPPSSQGLECAANRPERLVGRLRGVALPDGAADPVCDQVAVRLAGDRLDDGVLAACRADEVAEREEREAVSVRNAARREDAGAAANGGEQLGGDSRLPDARRSEDRGEPARAVALRRRELPAEEGQLVRPAHERSIE